MNMFRTLLAAGLVLAAGSSAWAASPPELLAQGEYIARAGDCIVCHTGEADKPFAGGLKMGTPLGAIYTTNITPDKDTGIGTYTFEDFDSAMRRGIAKGGRRLFPAMPYPSYANMAEADMRALYAFFMEGVQPAARATEKPELPSLINKPWMLNLGLAVWQGVFHKVTAFAPQTDRDAAWNRGAYLVEGLGHCGSCHTPRGIFFQEKALISTNPVFLSGAQLDYWSAPNLHADLGDGLGAWSEADTAAFLKTGHAPTSTAFGTMIDVVNNSTQYMTDADLAAMAKYIKSLPAGARPGGKTPVYDEATTKHLNAPGEKSVGERVYLQRCSSCHARDGKGRDQYLPPLFGNPAVLDADSSSLINVTLNGSQRIVLDGAPDAYRMIPFRVLLNDEEVAAVVSYIRGGWGNNAKPVMAKDVAVIRKLTDPASDQVVILKMR
ncbi:MAG: c-type cytochrome [Rhodospirillaceae bacterium]|nr:c-type cytochrome [Rhodospirillaceae bacterium]